ncbi:MAG TPA: mechanosensitive ion channel domain-containing protein [Cytophagaceae bacterium]|jgi:miniconductance mechanosensitive channel|nr:mechanosensitive ion channel domain-containing protein [Cytophagaceae bacterium]
MIHYTHLVYDYFITLGFNSAVSEKLNLAVLLVVSFVALLMVEYIARIILIQSFSQFAKNSKTKFDDILVLNKAPKNIAHLLPIYASLQLTPYVFIDFPHIEIVAQKILQIFCVIIILWIARSLLNSFKDYSQSLSHLRDKPINSYVQVFMIFAWITGLMIAYGLVTGTSIGTLFTILGAASAVIILIFKDTILGFVASIQVSINDMVRIGDWITFDKYGADGDVIEINLATVKVQNFDKTITTIPTYALISDSFKNWRGMEDSEGRRIKRAILIKQTSIRYLSEEAVERLKEIHLIHDYLEHRQKDISHYNVEHKINKSIPINGRNLTNIGVFRKYIDTYVANHSAINTNMTVMVRQLAPTSEGIPLEIYAFCKDKRGKNYEYVIADIFDHVLAAVPYFELELFELLDGGYFKKSQGL